MNCRSTGSGYRDSVRSSIGGTMSKEVNVVASVGLEAVRVTLAMEERVGGCLTCTRSGSMSPNGGRSG